MKISILNECNDIEQRVAITPDIVKKLSKLGVDVYIESHAGNGAGIDDSAYTAAGANIVETPAECVSGTHVLLRVNPPSTDVLALLPERSHILGMMAPYTSDNLLPAYSEKQITTFSLELLPRISRAQSMDVLSSQSNLAGYRSVIDAVTISPKAMPMMMTAAGTVPPAKVLILGAGVAGLQAIATAKRLGAVVSAFDVRPAVKEQVESLGAKFIEVKADGTEDGETKGGYAKEMSEEYKQRQQQLIFDTIIKQDMVITTALIPGKTAPTLITEAMVQEMKMGAVIVDLAASMGGNCAVTEADAIVEKHGVFVIGHTNLPAKVSADASQLYARNLFNFMSTLLIDENGALDIQWDDELIKGCLFTKEGQLVHLQFSHSEG